MSSIQNFEKPLFINCTPLNENDNRYMRWNSHGIIRHFKNEDTNQINVQFHNTSLHPSLEFPNEKDYSYADLSSNALIFASSKLLNCIHFDKDLEEHEWSIYLNKGEKIKSICLGEKFIAVGTNNRNIRFYSLNGTQHQLISVPGSIVCTIASNKTLVVIYHRQLPLPENELLDAMILEVDLEFNSVCNLEFSPIRLPISKNSNLRWIGFTDEGTLAFFDSFGSLKLFKNQLGLNWIEVANLFHQVDKNVENVFIISVSDFLEEVRCVLCFKSRYPSPEQIPVMQTLKFNISLCKTIKETNELEERNILSNIKCSMLNSLSNHDIDTSAQVKDALKEQVNSLFKIFQDANKSNNEQRQLDSAKLIPSLKTIESLIKYSEQSRLFSLVPKLNDLIENKKNDSNDHVNLYSALPTELSTLQRNESNQLTGIITPLIINKSIFEKPSIMEETMNTDLILVDLEPNKFDDNLNSNNGVQIIDEDDELLKEVTTNEIKADVKNPFKV